MVYHNTPTVSSRLSDFTSIDLGIHVVMLLEWGRGCSTQSPRSEMRGLTKTRLLLLAASRAVGRDVDGIRSLAISGPL